MTKSPHMACLNCLSFSLQPRPEMYASVPIKRMVERTDFLCTIGVCVKCYGLCFMDRWGDNLLLHYLPQSNLSLFLPMACAVGCFPTWAIVRW